MARPKLVDKDGRFLVPVVCDTREQAVYSFDGLTRDAADGGGPLTVPTVTGTLASGDYSLLGYEQRVAVERKSLSDLYSTLGQGRDRFERELERLAGFDFAAVVVEATWQQICAEPPEYTQLAPKTVFRSVLAWSVRYPRVHWFPCGPRRLAEVTTFRLLERFLKEELATDKQAEQPQIAGQLPRPSVYARYQDKVSAFRPRIVLDTRFERINLTPADALALADELKKAAEEHRTWTQADKQE